MHLEHGERVFSELTPGRRDIMLGAPVSTHLTACQQRLSCCLKSCPSLCVETIAGECEAYLQNILIDLYLLEAEVCLDSDLWCYYCGKIAIVEKTMNN